MNDISQAQPLQGQPQDLAADAQPKRGIIVFDLDGCVYLTDWREHLIKEQGFAAFHKMHVEDKVNPIGRKYLEDAISKNIFITFITGRTVDNIITTANQIISDFGIEVGKDFTVYMRPLDDKRSATDLKKEIVTLVIALANNNRTKVIGAFDDNLDVVNMYREHGLMAFKLDKEGCFMDDGQELPPITILDNTTFERYQDPTKSMQPAQAQGAAEPTPTSTGANRRART